MRAGLRIAAVIVAAAGFSGAVMAQTTAGARELPAAVPQDPSFLIGTWHITETLFPGTDREYVETSVRECAPVMAGAFVLCKSRGRARGAQRLYWFLVNQPSGPDSIEIMGAGNDYTDKTLYRGRFLEDGSGIDLRNFEIGPETMTAGSYQRLRFLSADEFVWTIGIRNPGTPDESVIGIERAIRVSSEVPFE